MSLRALVELLANKPLLRKKDLAQRYGYSMRGLDKLIAAGVIPRPSYLGRYPFWSPNQIANNEKHQTKLRNALFRVEARQQKASQQLAAQSR
jgi:predicted DNA-binding transcriptional regulator AlpA